MGEKVKSEDLTNKTDYAIMSLSPEATTALSGGMNLKNGMRRIVYYVWWATAEENEEGTHHRSQPYSTEKVAQDFATLKWETVDFVSIDKVHEVYEHYAWRMADGTETEIIEVE